MTTRRKHRRRRQYGMRMTHNVVTIPLTKKPGNTCPRCERGGWVMPDQDGDLRCVYCSRGLKAVLIPLEGEDK